jgi:hypothetical protein
MLETEKRIVNILVGSHLYGTATPLSDRDYKGVFLPSKEAILLGRIPKSYTMSTSDDHAKNTADDVDTELYSLHYFLRLACEGQTVALDMLHAPDNMLIESSDIWREIVSQRHRFHTKNLHSFVHYARRQASRYGVKGARLNAVNAVLNVLRDEAPSRRLQDIWHKLPRMEYCGEAGVDPQNIPQYQVCDKLFQATVSVDYVLPILEKFSREYGERAQQAAENRNIDWKAISHALRVAFQVKELLTGGTITFPLPQAELLVQVKTGQRDYLTDVAPLLETLMDEVETLISTSTLPEQVDTAYWDAFLCKTLEREVFHLNS